MKVKEKLQESGIAENVADFSDILASLETDTLSIKKDEVGTNLATLVAFSDTTRSALADILGWEKSRITRILSGMENLTLRTIHEVCKAVGYEFDITFRKKADAKALQPWQTLEIIYEKPALNDVYKITGKPVRTLNNVVSFITTTGANDDSWRFPEPKELEVA